MFKQPEINYLSRPPESDFLNRWVWESFRGYRLLIVAELHDSKELNDCEFATALLFSRGRDIPDERMPVWCYSSMDSFPHLLGKNLTTLLSAEQVKPASLRHVWTGNLKGESLHLLADAFSENRSDVNVRHWHSMLLADTWSPGYQWLMLEWAASAIRNGQHAQMLAVQHSKGQKINLLMINSEQPYIESLKDKAESQGFVMLYRLMGSYVMHIFTGILFYNCMAHGFNGDQNLLLTAIFIFSAFVALVFALVVPFLDFIKQRSALHKYSYRE